MWEIEHTTDLPGEYRRWLFPRERCGLTSLEWMRQCWISSRSSSRLATYVRSVVGAKKRVDSGHFGATSAFGHSDHDAIRTPRTGECPRSSDQTGVNNRVIVTL